MHIERFLNFSFHDSNFLTYASLHCYQNLSLSASRLTSILDMDRRSCQGSCSKSLNFLCSYTDHLYLNIHIGRVWTHQFFPFKPLKALFKLYQKSKKKCRRILEAGRKLLSSCVAEAGRKLLLWNW